MMIFCTGCGAKVEARLTNGREIYPHRNDLFVLPFWKCDTCGNFVGCHHKTVNGTRPLGCIPTPAIKAERQKIHKVLDPLWKTGGYGRKEIYRIVADQMGMREAYHTAQIRSVDEARKVLDIIEKLQKDKK